MSWVTLISAAISLALAYRPPGSVAIAFCATSTSPSAHGASAGSVRQVVTLQQGVPSEAAREIVKFLKDAKLKKVQVTIQGDQLRVTAPAKDELQTAMAALRGNDFGIELQFGNYRS